MFHPDSSNQAAESCAHQVVWWVSAVSVCHDRSTLQQQEFHAKLLLAAWGVP